LSSPILCSSQLHLTMHPKNINIRDFTYELPESRIAKYPLTARDDSKLLIYQQGRITEDRYRNIADYFSPGSFLLFNNTRVIEARILFQKPTGGVIEIFCLEPHEQYGEIRSAMSQQGKVLWKCLIGGASKWKKGDKLEKKIQLDQSLILLQANYIGKKETYFVIEFSWQPGSLSFAELIHIAGITPLPPYIKREVDKSDSERYQTIYAKYDGSVAAPTAGLHFTDHIFNQFREKNILWDFITLHVGAGTFQPVKTERLEQHVMHGEFIEVSKKLIEKILVLTEGKLIAVGTTSMRALESLFWLGVRVISQPTIEKQELVINQWDAYEMDTKNISPRSSLQSLLEWLDRNRLDKLITKTQLLIAPGYEFRMVRGLVTNFHQPQSTLLLLVAALIKEDWKKVYQYALDNDFRFLSYGDGCLLFGRD